MYLNEARHIPAIGATPYALSGAIYPFATLPGRRSPGGLVAALGAHAVALLRYGFMGSDASGLAPIWHLHSQAAMAAPQPGRPGGRTRA